MQHCYWIFRHRRGLKKYLAQSSFFTLTPIFLLLDETLHKVFDMGVFGRQFLVHRLWGFCLKPWGFFGFGFLSPFDHRGCLECTPLGLYQTLYVLFHPIVEKLESIWKSLIVLYFFNPLLCVWIFNNNVASRVCYNNMKLVLKFSFSLQCSFFVSMKTLFLKYHATPTPLEQSVSLKCVFFPFLGWTWRLRTRFTWKIFFRTRSYL